MARVAPTDIPNGSSLAGYASGDHYVDCFVCGVAGNVALAEFVTAFYQTPLFRLEAMILSLSVRKPSTHQDAVDLAAGRRDRFAAWTVEDRRPDALLMCDMGGRTRSWFGVEPAGDGTRLLFGSVVTAVPDAQGNMDLGRLFRVLLPFHKLYARALLWSAQRRLAKA